MIQVYNVGMINAFDIMLAFVLLLVLAFEIWMLVSAITNKFISDNTKILWVVGMLLIHPIVAIFYYFTDYKKTL